MSDRAVLVRCHEVALTFGSGAGAVVAVHGSSCVVAPAARVALSGPSGSGKSTLLHLMAGLETPTGGSVSWPDIHGDSVERTRQIGVVFQGSSLVATLDVAENVALPLMLRGLDPRTSIERAVEALDGLDLGSVRSSLPEELSGGQAQRVVVARVLAQQPRLILADEPTGQLDHATGQHMMDVLLSAADDLGAALVVSTHDPAVRDRLDAHWAMVDGRLVGQTETP